MRNMLRKEMGLSASVLSYVFIVFGFMFMLPGYPILCGVFFSTLGIYKSFEYAREANDSVFSALLPVAKKDVVKGRFCFVVFIEVSTAILMLVSIVLRMTVLADSEAYRSNPLMNANLFALGTAFVMFGLFNSVFVAGFYKTAYKTGRPFLIYIIIAFLCIGIAEAMHYVPGLSFLNAFGTDNLLVQILLLIVGILAWLVMSVLSCNRSCDNFEKIDL